MGPELGFGHVAGWYHDEPVLIIKTSEGNRGIGWNIRPPGSLRFESGDKTCAAYGESPQNWLTSGGGPSHYVRYAGKDYDDFFHAEADFGARLWANGVVYPSGSAVRCGQGEENLSARHRRNKHAHHPGLHLAGLVSAAGLAPAISHHRKCAFIWRGFWIILLDSSWPVVMMLPCTCRRVLLHSISEH